MTAEEINRDFIKTIDAWQKGLDAYTAETFALKPDDENWSVGQVCSHLMASTRRVFTVIDKCLAGNNNEHEEKTEAGNRAFVTNVMSEMKIKVPATLQAQPPQAESVAAVKKELEALKPDFTALTLLVEKSGSTGKEKHAVLGFLNAREWLHMIEMHFRHHLKQKQSIDVFLNSLQKNN